MTKDGDNKNLTLIHPTNDTSNHNQSNSDTLGKDKETHDDYIPEDIENPLDQTNNKDPELRQILPHKEKW